MERYQQLHLLKQNDSQGKGRSQEGGDQRAEGHTGELRLEAKA